jgi:hypothetical protein
MAAKTYSSLLSKTRSVGLIGAIFAKLTAAQLVQQTALIQPQGF